MTVAMKFSGVVRTTPEFFQFQDRFQPQNEKFPMFWNSTNDGIFHK